MPKLFKREERSTGGGAPRLSPTQPKAIDVVNDFSWTLSPRAARTEVPTIHLVEYELISSGLLAAFERYSWIKGNFKSGSGLSFSTGNQPYNGLYPARETKFRYDLPYFDGAYRSIQNAWEDSDAFTSIPLVDRIPVIGEYLGLYGIQALAKAFYVGVGHEIPKSYAAGHLEEISVAFILNNTTNIDDVKQNWELIYLLSYQNLQNRKNYILVDPPCIYTYKIEGVKYCPAAAITSMTVGNLGQVKKVTLGGGEQNIPEAWAVDIRLKDLIPISQNMLDAMSQRNMGVIEATQGYSAEDVLKKIGKPPNP